MQGAHAQCLHARPHTHTHTHTHTCITAEPHLKQGVLRLFLDVKDCAPAQALLHMYILAPTHMYILEPTHSRTQEEHSDLRFLFGFHP